MGKRQIGQLQPFELAITIMIADLSTIPMQNTGIPLINGIIPILTLLIAQLFLSFISIKSNTAERIICGKPTILVENGKIKLENLRNELYTLSDLLEQLRLKNSPNLADVEFAILETNGDLSIVPKTPNRPITLKDLNIPSEYQGLALPIILDGSLIEENLEILKFNKNELMKILKEKNINSIDDITLGSLDTSGNFYYQHK
jgi:uncharacterized membrane protein YcaP (DUF421 family)